MTDIIRKTHGDDIADLIDSSSLAKQSLKQIFKSKAVSTFELCFIVYREEVGRGLQDD